MENNMSVYMYESYLGETSNNTHYIPSYKDTRMHVYITYINM